MGDKILQRLVLCFLNFAGNLALSLDSILEFLGQDLELQIPSIRLQNTIPPSTHAAEWPVAEPLVPQRDARRSVRSACSADGRVLRKHPNVR